MTEDARTEIALSPGELASILRLCAPEGLLVGGQALAFWVDRLTVPRPAELASNITTDADFIGNAQLARRLGRAMGWKTWVPSLDDATPQLAKVTHAEPDGAVKQVDFLSGVVGLTTKDVKRRAMLLDVAGIGLMSVMHPVDVLDSRVQNLHLLASKRTPAGFAQARLAISMVKAFIRAESVPDERPGLKQLERVVGIAQDYAGLLVHVLYGIDVLDAVPLDAFHRSSELHARRWPQVVAKVGAQRAALAKLAGRVREPDARSAVRKRPTRVTATGSATRSTRPKKKKAR